MLTITVPGEEYFDEEKEEFITVGDVVLELEHSLVTLSKWESEFEKPFLSEEKKTDEEAFAYIKHMILTPDFPPEVLTRLSQQNMEAINDYISAKMTATWFSDTGRRGPNRETLTSELIYYWMVAFNIPFECERWHLNRLFTLIRVCSAKNDEQSSKKKPMTSEDLDRRRELNAQRRAEMGTNG